MAPTGTLKEFYDSEGYIIVPGLILPEDLGRLKNAAAHVIQLTRDGNWSHRRTVGKQFPPFNADSPDSWGVQHVMHPELGAPEFVRWYTSDALVAVAKELLACSEDDLQMGRSLKQYYEVKMTIFYRKKSYSTFWSILRAIILP